MKDQWSVGWDWARESADHTVYFFTRLDPRTWIERACDDAWEKRTQ